MIASIEPGRRKIRRSNGAIDYPFYERRMKRLRRLALQRLIKRLKTAISRHGNPRPQPRPLTGFRL